MPKVQSQQPKKQQNKPASNGSQKSGSKQASASPPADKGQTAQKGKGKKVPPPAPREVLYEDIEARVARGDEALTPELAKELLGWQVAPEGVKEGVYVLGDKRVFLTNNVRNRPLYMSHCEALQQEMLNNRWRLNGEAIIIGKTGLVLNGQHTLIALALAGEEREKHASVWAQMWPKGVSIEKVIVLGVEEDDATVNTMDTCKPRSLMDVIYRSEFFAAMPSGQRKEASKRLSDAVKMLWHRTGAGLDAFAPRRTHAEALSFIERHPKILKCVKHVMEEDGTDRKIGRFLSPGYSAALLYLMGSSTTDRDEKGGYSTADPRSEKQLDFRNWDKAQEFWTLLAAGHVSMAPIREELGRILEKGVGSIAERVALLVKSWCCWIDAGEIDPDDIALEYNVSTEGERVLAECPAIGGIDEGNPTKDSQAEGDTDTHPAPTEEPAEEELENPDAAE